MLIRCRVQENPACYGESSGDRWPAAVTRYRSTKCKVPSHSGVVGAYRKTLDWFDLIKNVRYICSCTSPIAQIIILKQQHATDEPDVDPGEANESGTDVLEWSDVNSRQNNIYIYIYIYIYIECYTNFSTPSMVRILICSKVTNLFISLHDWTTILFNTQYHPMPMRWCCTNIVVLRLYTCLY